MSVRVIHGDCREILPTLDADSIDAIVTDPPYELGFMGKGWDRTGIANDVAMWRACLRVLKPGGHIVAFGGTRTYHRMACVLARKPLIGTVASNVLAHGTGALNIDGCRVEGAPPQVTGRGWSGARVYGHAESAEAELQRPADGRWPANVLHDGSDEVVAAFPQAPGQLRADGPQHGAKDSTNVFGDYGPRDQFNPRGDAGSAARFFYTAKTSAAERSDGLHTVTAAGRNHHPTVKPTDLMRWLVRLITPPGGTVLDPFMGSGSTLKAAELEGFSAIGIDLEPEYVEIARRRIASDAPLFAEVTMQDTG